MPNIEDRAQALAHTAITDVKNKLAALEGKFAAATNDHLAVPKSLLQELRDDIHTAEMWFLHLFPHLKPQVAQQEAQGQPATAATVAAEPSPATVTQVVGDPQPGGQGATNTQVDDTPIPASADKPAA